MVYNTNKGKLPRNQQRRNPQGSPAGSGVPGMKGDARARGVGATRRVVGLKQVKGKDGVVRGVWVTKQKKLIKRKPGKATAEQRDKWKRLTGATRAARAASAPEKPKGYMAMRRMNKVKRPQTTSKYIVGQATPARSYVGQIQGYSTTGM